MSNKTVILGTAHGVNVPGKCSPDKSHREYIWSRDMCKRVAAKLKAAGVNVLIDIENEVEPSLTKRVQIVNNLVKQNGGASNCVYISIHNNAAGSNGEWRSARGFCVYVSPNASIASRQLATSFHKRAQAAGLKGNRAYPANGYYIANLYVCRATSCPAVLTENLFQDNREDVAFLDSEKGKEVIAQLHADAILENIK